MKVFLSISCCLIICFNAFTQDLLPPEKTKKLTKKAEQAQQMGDPFTAIDYYEKLLTHVEEDEKQADVYFHTAYQLGHLYREIRNYSKAADKYKEVWNNRKGSYAKSRFHYAQMLQMQGAYKSAKSIFKKLKDNYRGDDLREVRKRSEAGFKGCKMALKEPADTNQWKIRHLGKDVNSSYSEYSPLLVKDSMLIYASRKLDSLVTLPTGKKLGNEHTARFYKARKKGDQWETIGEFGAKFNHPRKPTGNGAISPDGKRFYFTRCKLNQASKMVCHIYFSRKENRQWQEPKKLEEPINLENYTTTQPTVGKYEKSNQEILYFASDRPRGKGGMDIWYVPYDKSNQEFGRPKNAGRKVNTARDEMTPYYYLPENALYFSSDYHPGFGGLDVFKIKGNRFRWNSAPKNVGRPINSSADDLYFTKYKYVRKSFLVSNRQGSLGIKHATCCDDVYAVIPKKEPLITMKSKVVQRLDTVPTPKPLDGSAITLYKIDHDQQGENIIVRQDTTGKKGRFQFRLKEEGLYFLKVQKSGFMAYLSDTLSIDPSLNDTAGISQRIEMDSIPKEPVILKNIYYKFDKAKLTQESRTILDTTLATLLKANPSLIVQINSHTDAKGSDEYNKELSQERAESVVDYLVGKGMDSTRLKAKGFGESQPIAPNFKPDGSDNPEGRRKNRRTEFKIIGEMRGNKKLIYKE